MTDNDMTPVSGVGCDDFLHNARETGIDITTHGNAKVYALVAAAWCFVQVRTMIVKILRYYGGGNGGKRWHFHSLDKLHGMR
jgi:hypothetical protein